MTTRFRTTAGRLALLSLLFALTSAGTCSRARVESLNKMNEAVSLAHAGQTVQAVEALERARALDPTNEQVSWNLAMVHLEQHKYDAARDALQQAIAASPNKGTFHEKLGAVLMQLKDWTGAKAALEKAIATDPTLFKAYYRLGRVEEQLENEQGALQRYTEAVQKGPRFLESYAALGRLYANLGYMDQAQTVLEAGLQVAIPGTEEEATVHHLLGTVYLQQRKIPEATREFRNALNITPGLTDSLFSLGSTLAQGTDREEGVRYLRKFLEVAGNNAPRGAVKAAQDLIAKATEGI